MTTTKPEPGPPTAEDRYFVPAEGGSRHQIFPGVSIRTVAGESMMLSVVHFEPDSIVLDHEHPHEQMGVLISGQLEFTIGETTRLIGPGDAWRIPGGVRHHVRAVGGPAVAFDMFHPIREDYR